MPDPTPQTPAEQTPEAGQDPQPTPKAAPQPDPTPDPTPDPPLPADGPVLTQADVDTAAAAARRKAEAELATANAELEKYKTAAEEQRQAKLSETQKATEAAKKAEAAQAKAEADLAAANANALRATLVMAEAPDLPNAYKSQVTGHDEDAIKESIGMAREAHDADFKGLVSFVDLKAMMPEQIVERFPDDEDAKAFAERLKGSAVSIGGPSNAGGQPPTPQGDVALGQAFDDLNDPEKALTGAQRQQSWMGTVSKKARELVGK